MRPVVQRRFDMPDLLFGLFLVLVATGALVATRKLTFGSAAEMGPGYMPRVVSLGLLGFGLFFTGRGLFGRWQGIERVHLRPLLAIPASVAVFALLATTAGLAIASFVTVAVAGAASRETRLMEILLFGAGLSAAAVLLFVKLLALPVPVWP